jgi:rare lipoprotein A (peptidoglycan hydrolase)
VWLLCNVVLTIVLVPALFPADDGVPDAARALAVHAGTSERPMRATSAGGRDEVVIWSAVAAEAMTSTTVTVPPTTAPPTTAAPRPVVRVAATPTTTTTAKPRPAPTTTTTAAPARDGERSETGKGTWYDSGTPGVCAHKTLPFGTVVTVTNVANGKSVTCTVHDRGPYVDGYIIDLNPQEFSKIAPLSAGVINARITW